MNQLNRNLILACDRQRTLINKYLPGDTCVGSTGAAEKQMEANDELEATQCIISKADNIHSPVWSCNSTTEQLEMELKLNISHT